MIVDGNVALVTGGASGLGEATARRLHSLGAHVVLFDRDEDRAKAIVAELGERADHIGGNAIDEHDSRASVELASSLGPLRIVVACAGGGKPGQRTVQRDGSPHDLDLFDDTWQLNVTTTFNTLRFAAARMATQEPVTEDGERGVIILTSSLAGYEGQIGQIAYATAKAGIIGMTINAARDLAVLGVRVNTIAPGTMLTRAWEGGRPEVREALEAKVPFPKRFGQPEEFADAATFLIGNGYMNGHVLRLDGAIRFDPK